MSFLLGLAIVTMASTAALIFNDRFHLGGYIDDEELPLPPADSAASEERVLTAAGRK